MRHNTLQNLLEELLDNSDEIVISSNSKHAALYVAPDGEVTLLEGDFTGSEEEVEAKVRRIMNNHDNQGEIAA